MDSEKPAVISKEQCEHVAIETFLHVAQSGASDMNRLHAATTLLHYAQPGWDKSGEPDDEEEG